MSWAEQCLGLFTTTLQVQSQLWRVFIFNQYNCYALSIDCEYQHCGTDVFNRLCMNTLDRFERKCKTQLHCQDNSCLAQCNFSCLWLFVDNLYNKVDLITTTTTTTRIVPKFENKLLWQRGIIFIGAAHIFRPKFVGQIQFVYRIHILRQISNLSRCFSI